MLEALLARRAKAAQAVTQHGLARRSRCRGSAPVRLAWWKGRLRMRGAIGIVLTTRATGRTQAAIFGSTGVRRLFSVAQFLAVQAVSSPRQTGEAFGRDRLFALEAYAKLAVVDALERRSESLRLRHKRFHRALQNE